jgi:Family of unknown function (DUF6069)
VASYDCERLRGTRKESQMTAVTDVPIRRRPRGRVLLRAGLAGGVIASAATTAVGAIARAADVPLEIDGERIPLAGFAQLTLIAAVVGVALAAAIRSQRAFLTTSVVATAASFAPSLTLADDAATKFVLVLTHVVAAAIIIPSLAGSDAWSER